MPARPTTIAKPVIGTSLGVDPGFEYTAWVVYDGHRPVRHAKEPNEIVLRRIRNDSEFDCDTTFTIEMVAAAGMAGLETFDTAYWVGRFLEAWEHRKARHDNAPLRIRRSGVLKHITGSGESGGADSRLRQALIDHYGPTQERAIGKKDSPGPLHGIVRDRWSALAIAMTGYDKHIDELEVKARFRGKRSTR